MQQQLSPSVQDDQDIERLLQPDSGIVKHRGKIESAVNNARIAMELQQEHGSLARYLWGLMPDKRPIINEWQCATHLLVHVQNSTCKHPGGKATAQGQRWLP